MPDAVEIETGVVLPAFVAVAVSGSGLSLVEEKSYQDYRAKPQA